MRLPNTSQRLPRSTTWSLEVAAKSFGARRYTNSLGKEPSWARRRRLQQQGTASPVPTRRERHR